MKNEKLKKQLKKIARMNMAVGLIAIGMLVSESSLAISDTFENKKNPDSFFNSTMSGNLKSVEEAAYCQALNHWEHVLGEKDEPKEKQTKSTKNTITVNSNLDNADDGDPSTTTLREAIHSASDDDVIIFALANANKTITLASDLTSFSDGYLDINLEIDGSNINGDDIIIDGAGTYRAFYVYNVLGIIEVDIHDLTINNCDIAGNGPALRNNGEKIILSDVTITNCEASGTNHSGAIHNTSSGNLTLNNCILNNNTAGVDGGALNNSNSSTVIINNSTFENNIAGGSGGAVYNNGTLTLNSSTISGNTADGNGDDLLQDNENLTLNGTNNIDDIHLTGANTYNNGILNSEDLYVNGGYGKYYGGTLDNNDGASITIASGGTLDIEGTLNNNSGATFTLESGASMIDNGTLNNNGTFNTKFEVSESIWHLISPPLPAATTNIFVGDFLQNWSEANQLYYEITPTDETLTPVQGYGLWAKPGKSDHTYTFTGTPNTGSKSVALTEDGSGESAGFNLVGNPYPSSIDWAGLDGNYGAIHYWNGTAYVDWNDGSGSGSRYAPPMQGFFIEADEKTSFSLSNNNRTHEGAESFYKNSDKNIENGLVLFADNGNYQDDLWILIREEQSPLFDFDTDARKMLSNTEGLSQIWSVASDKKFSIDARPYQQNIQLGFKNDRAGNYSIGIKQIDGINFTEIEDSKLNKFHDLTTGAYSFDWDITDSEERFILHLKATGIDDLSSSNTKIFAYQKTINIRSNEKLNNAQISIIDMMGRTVYEQALVDGQNESIVVPLEDGVYLVQLVSDSGTVVEKVILR